VRDRLNKGYEIYHAETPNKIVHRFEANTPREAKRYYDDFITKYESDVDYDLRLRRATGLNEFAPSPERNNNDDVPDPIFVLANRWWNAADKQPQIESVLNSMGWSIHQVESEDDAVQLTHRDGTTYFISADDFDPDLFENTEDYAGMQLRLSKDSDGVAVRALAGGKELGMAEFFFDNEGRLDPQTVWVDERYHGQGIAAAMYDYLKDKGYTIIRSWDQTDAGRGFWDKHRGAEATVWEAHIPTILPGDDEEQTPPPEKSQRYAGQPRAYHVLGYNGTLMSPAMRKFLTAHVKHPKDANWSNVVVVEYDPQWYTHTFGRSNNPVLQKIHSWEDFWNLILKRYFVELQAPRKVQS
jgi:GNAT superfamily N-acetyltransferase